MNDWIRYWDKENIISDNIWAKNNAYFFKNTLKIIDYSKDDIVIDLGSGKGFFAELIANKVKELHLIDTSKNSIDFCKFKFKGYSNISYSVLNSDNYTNFDFIETKPNKIFVISVIQYYKSLSEVKTLIRNCKKISNPENSLLFLADIPVNKNMLNDIFSMINSSLKLGTFFDTISFFIKSFFGDYRKTRKSIKIRTYTISELRKLLDEMDLSYEIHKGITNIKGRISILIRFSI